MPNLTICPSSTQVQNQVCALAAGGPTTPQRLSGEGTPEASVTGFYPGLDQYYDKDTDILYVFNGEIGANTGWVAINP